jgi:hypothetical protein
MIITLTSVILTFLARYCALAWQREAGRGAHGQQFAAIQSHEMFPHPVLGFGGQIAGVRWKRQRRLSAYRL